MAGNDLSALGRRLDKLADEVISGKQLTRVATAVGMMAKKQVHEVTGEASLGGDWTFSGWRQKSNELAVQFDLGEPGMVTIKPANKSRGPWVVAELGRHSSGDRPGPRLTKSGKVSRAKVKKWNGQTKGKGSWTQFQAAVDRRTMDTVAKETRAAVARAVMG